MDMLAAYASDSDSDSKEYEVVHSAVEEASDGCRATGDEPPIKRTRLEAARDGSIAPFRAHTAQQTVLFPNPPAALKGDSAVVTSTCPCIASSCRISGNAGAAEQQAPAVAAAHTAAAGPAYAQQQQQQQATNINDMQPPRIRCFPHVEGEFPFVVYVPVPDNYVQQLQQLATALVSQCPKLPAAPYGVPADLADPAAAATNAKAPAATDTTAAAPNPADTVTAGVSNSNGVVSPGTLRLWPTCSLPAQSTPLTNNSSSNSNSSRTLNGPKPQEQQQQQEQQEQDLPLHMSLSRTLPIKHIQIASLKAALVKQLKGFRPFKVELQGLACLVNDAGTRSFVCIKVAKGFQQVVRLIGGVDRAFAIHGLQTFHEEPLPHVSLAWTPGDQRHLLQPWLDAFEHETITMQVSQAAYSVAKKQVTVWEP